MDKQLALVSFPADKSSSKQQLLTAIKKRQTQLKQLMLKTELLQVRLDLVKQEYSVRVGNLIIKDNLLDLEIIQSRNLLRYIEEGLTLEQAKEEIKKKYYSEQYTLEQEQERLRFDEEIYLKRLERKEQEADDNLKKLWKQLILKFHPDLVQEPSEKEERTELIKQINRAYEERDYKKLLAIENDQAISLSSSNFSLEETLIRLENEIQAEKQKYQQLKQTEWYSWEKKIKIARRKQLDLFAQMERTLLNDIVAKLAILEQLRAEIQQQENSTSH